jgi:tRNA (guanine37-N1)-methyltransferase
MRIDVLTLFPEVIESYVQTSIVGRAQQKQLVEIAAINFREFSSSKHHNVDDYPFGGGAGMVLSPQPIVDALESVRTPESVVIYLTPKGHVFNQSYAKQLSKKEHLIMICGHYEGLDQRVIDHHVDLELSIGDYVLSGGEIPALAVVDAVTRLLPGAITSESLEEESHTNFLLEYPHYTRPRIFEDKEIPEILLSGHHANIDLYRLEESIRMTIERRPDMIDKGIKHKAFSKNVLKIIEKIKRSKDNF